MPPVSASFKASDLPPLIGRADELGTALSRLRDRASRLLTVTGPAGVGKTRFALDVTAALCDIFVDGVVAVDLTHITDPGDLDIEMGRTLGFRVRNATTLAQQIDDYLADRAVLLFLDNAEHVLGIGPRLIEWLGVSPGSSALVTSRHRLNVSLEDELDLDTLPVTDVSRLNGSQTLSALSPAAQVFLQTVDRCDDGAHDLTPEVLGMIERVCAQFDGLPLALEIAAARLSDVSPQALAQFTQVDVLPETGDVDTVLEQAVDWSYRLLSPGARQLLRYLTVYTAGFSLELVERQVARATGIELGDVSVFDCLLELSDHHLILPLQNAEIDTPRFRMLMMVYEIARRKRAEHGEELDAQQAHAGAMIDYAEAREYSGMLPGREYQIGELELNYHNLIAALTWLDEQDDVDGLLRLAGALAWFWFAHGHYQVGRQWIERVLARNARSEGVHRARLMTGYGNLLDVQGEFAHAREVLAEAYDLFVASRHQFGMSYTSVVLGIAAFHMERYGDADRFLSRAIACARDVRDSALGQTVEGLGWANLGANAHEQGLFDDAEEALRRAIMIHRRIGLRWGVARALCDIGSLDRDRGHHQAALDSYQAVLGPARRLRDHRLIAASLAGLATVLAHDGQTMLSAWAWGAIDALEPIVGKPSLLSCNLRAYARGQAIARSALGSERYHRTLQAGSQAPLDDVLQLAGKAALRQGQLTVIPVDIERRLTSREMEVLRYLVLGASTRAIAASLGIRERTVSSHTAAVFRKLNVNSRLELVALTIRSR